MRGLKLILTSKNIVDIFKTLAYEKYLSELYNAIGIEELNRIYHNNNRIYFENDKDWVEYNLLIEKEEADKLNVEQAEQLAELRKGRGRGGRRKSLMVWRPRPG